MNISRAWIWWILIWKSIVIFFCKYVDNLNGVSIEKLERESKTLDIKYDDLLKVFTEPSFLAQGMLWYNYFPISVYN